MAVRPPLAFDTTAENCQHQEMQVDLQKLALYHPKLFSLLAMQGFARVIRDRVAITLVLLFALVACSSTREAAGIANVRDVRAALDTSVAAWNRGDLVAHVAIYADSAVLVPATEARGPTQARRTLERFFRAPQDRPVLALDSLQLQALGDAYVLARGQYVLAGGRVDDVPRRGWFTEVWAHTAQGWRIIHDHSS